MQLGRIRVRIHGIHTDNTQEIPDDGLPWAQTIVPITEGGTNGLGNITGIQPNARVFGIFLDGANSQLPLILGSLPKLEESSAGGRSTDQRIRGGDDGKLASDPACNDCNRLAIARLDRGHGAPFQPCAQPGAKIP